jgi:hypothetical protein
VPLDSIAGLMTAFEQSALGHAARGTAWLYPLVNLLHVLGAALLVGGITIFDIQVLRRRRDVRAIWLAAFPITAIGLLLQAGSGTVLLSAEATTVARNPAFQFKMAMLALALVNVAAFHWRFGRALRTGASIEGAYALALVSLVAWVLVLLAGRAIAYL